MEAIAAAAVLSGLNLLQLAIEGQQALLRQEDLTPEQLEAINRLNAATFARHDSNVEDAKRRLGQ